MPHLNDLSCFSCSVLWEIKIQVEAFVVICFKEGKSTTVVDRKMALYVNYVGWKKKNTIVSLAKMYFYMYAFYFNRSMTVNHDASVWLKQMM